MAIEAIRKVTQSEQEAQARRDAAAAENRQQVAQAQKQARTMLEESRQRAEGLAKELMRKAEEKAARENEEFLEQARQDCQRMKEEARKRLDQAADCIVEKVVKG